MPADGRVAGDACVRGTVDDLNLESGDDLLCIACGYDLRELPRDFNCPECGLPIKRSVGSDKLARADPAWLRKIVIGQSLIAWGTLGALCVIPVLCLFMFLLMVSMTLNGDPLWIRILAWITIFAYPVLLVLGAIAFFIGSFFVTVASPQSFSEADKVTTRSVVRYSILGSLFFGASYAGLTAAPPSATVLFLLYFTGVTCAGGVAIVIIALLSHLQFLLWQIPDRSLSKSVHKIRNFFTWALPMEILLRLLSMVGTMVLTPSTVTPITLADAAGCVEIFLAIAILIRIIQMMNEMFRVRQAFRLCHSISRSVTEQYTSQAE